MGSKYTGKRVMGRERKRIASVENVGPRNVREGHAYLGEGSMPGALGLADKSRIHSTGHTRHTSLDWRKDPLEKPPAHDYRTGSWASRVPRPPSLLRCRRGSNLPNSTSPHHFQSSNWQTDLMRRSPLKNASLQGLWGRNVGPDPSLLAAVLPPLSWRRNRLKVAHCQIATRPSHSRYEREPLREEKEPKALGGRGESRQRLVRRLSANEIRPRLHVGPLRRRPRRRLP